MAQVGRPPAQVLAFNSVFSNSSLYQSKRSRSNITEAEVDLKGIKNNIRIHVKACLGIEGRFSYGGEDSSYDHGRFRLPISESSPSFEPRAPSQAETVAQQSKWSHSPLWYVLGPLLKQMGVGSVKVLLGDVMNGLLPEFVYSAYTRCYRVDVVDHLKFWIQYVFSGFVTYSLGLLGSGSKPPSPKDVLRWQELALSRLGSLRVDELYYMIVDLHASGEGIEQLRSYITSPATRSYLTTAFISRISEKLLHPGASTIEILQTYISIIRAFRQLDPKGVLLDRVARPVRRYLRERDDTVKVIVGGLLSDPVDAEGDHISPTDDHLSELALELVNESEQDSIFNDDELDWQNMDWMPDPIDTAPDYMKSRNTDVIGSLTSLFESKDIFMKELQSALADRLLRNKLDFDLEISIVDHLKARFGDNALQGCEVMLRDVLDSRKVDSIIKKEQSSHSRKRKVDSSPELRAKVLSRLFWPTMSEQDFTLPAAIQKQQEQYERGFEALKNSRKLTWVPSMGQVEVELQLADRVFHEEVLPYQATVIYAFQETSSAVSIAELSDQLSMSALLARSACIFWVSKRILTESDPDSFTVLERLPSGSEDVLMTNNASIQDNTAIAAAEAAAAQAARDAEEEDRKQKMAMYHQFIVSMLTNQGAMPLSRIAMMLGMVVPGGFPFSNEELKEFMGGMVKEGALEVGPGGNWKVAG